MFTVSEEMPPRMKFRLSHTGDVTSNDEQPQNLSAPPTADSSAKIALKTDRNLLSNFF